MKFKVVVTDLLNDSLDPERRVLGDIATLEALNCRAEEELIGRVEDAYAILLYHTVTL